MLILKSILLSTLFLGQALGQDEDPIDALMRRHREMIQKFFDKDTRDSLLNDLLGEDWDQLGQGFSFLGGGIKSEWKDVPGGRELWVETGNEESQLDVRVEQGTIFLEGNIVEKEKKEGGLGQFYYQSQKKISQQIPVPDDLDPNSVSIEKNKNFLVLKFKNGKNQQAAPSPHRVSPPPPTKQKVEADPGDEII